MNTFAENLRDAVACHGHLCGGMIIGVRMARTALRLLEIDDPLEFRGLVVYVECDRCLTDAIGTVTGCRLGRRNMKWLDYGKSAATFLNTQTGEAVRVCRRALPQTPEGADLTAFFEAIPDDDMFRAEHVIVHYKPEDLPGKPLDAVTCPRCGEEVIDGRQVILNSVAVCKACAGGSYYSRKPDAGGTI